MLSTVFLFASPEPILIAVLVSFAGLMLLSKRVIFISNRNFNGKSEQEDMLLNTVLSLAKTIDARDQYTAFHSNNVAEYARSIAKELGLKQEEVESIYLAGLIHDIGKIATPDHILQKEGRLTTNRSYRQKLAIETAADELQRFSGTQFDPAAAKAFLKVLTREGKLQGQEEAAAYATVQLLALAISE